MHPRIPVPENLGQIVGIEHGITSNEIIMAIEKTDFLVIGGGVIGINLALRAKERFPDCKVTLVDKEEDFGLHASGRNSGVLHAGFYYSADSLKARFTRDGNAAMTAYCEEKGLSINRCGKLVVAQDASELPALQILLDRGKKNGVEVFELTEQEAKEIEPRVKTFQKALHSPTTSSINPRQVMASLAQDAVDAGVEMCAGEAFLRHRGKSVQVGNRTLECGYVINSAGLYADKIARAYGFSQNYRILPFKGLYLYVEQPEEQLRTNIYPVPDLNNPFLGVHFTITESGAVKIGPTAIPAFWREHYGGLQNYRFSEFTEIIWRELGLFVRNKNDFRSLAFSEMRKHFRSTMVHLASGLVSGLTKAQCTHWGPPGIRAQLLDIDKGTLEMDFCYEGDENSFHVLNAVSPAFTCSQPFTHYLFDEIERLAR